MKKIMGKEYLTEKEVCGVLGFSVAWIRKRRERNEAPPYIRFSPGGQVFFEKVKLNEWVKEKMSQDE